MARLRWKKKKRPTGLAAIGSAPPGYIYHDGEKQYASVSPLSGGRRGAVRGWFWVAGWDSDIPHKNTCDTPCETVDEAKRQAAAYVKENLPSPPKA